MVKGRLGMYVAVLIFVVMVVFVVCLLSVKPKTEKRSHEVTSIDSIPQGLWNNLAEMRIFFGHQSVGRNLIEGIEDVMAEHPEIKLTIVEASNLESIDGPAFIHCNVGRNTRPDSKLTDFRKVLESGGEEKTDIALLKFCYVDIGQDSDAHEVFRNYDLALSELAEHFKDTTFVHSTIPIQSGPSEAMDLLKEIIKPVLGKPRVVEKNGVRQSYNNLLRSKFLGNKPVFDIAMHETIGPGGLLSYRELDSEKVYFMDARYSDDGGHLNQLGRKHIAEQLLVTLARAAEAE
jgi:hypothetical protein